MSDFILIFMGVFILILIILIFSLLAYVYTSYVSYTVEINKNLNDSEETINKTNDAFNKLQDKVVDNIATVKTNQDKILENNKDYLNTLDSNIIKLFSITNNNSNINSIISSNLDNSKPLNINFNSDNTTYRTINAITNSTQNLNICNNETDLTKRKCINMNIDNNGLFSINTKNNLANDPKSNIANIVIKNYDNNILASFNGESNLISLGSNINPAISIKNNIYTPDIIVCNYKLNNSSGDKISLSIISNINISKDVFINFYLFQDMIDSIATAVSGSNFSTVLYNNNSRLLKIKSTATIEKNIITTFEIPISKKSGYLSSETYSTNGFISIE